MKYAAILFLLAAAACGSRATGPDQQVIRLLDLASPDGAELLVVPPPPEPLLVIGPDQSAPLVESFGDGSRMTLDGLDLMIRGMGVIEIEVLLDSGDHMVMWFGQWHGNRIRMGVDSNTEAVTFRYTGEQFAKIAGRSVLHSLAFTFPATPPEGVHFRAFRVYPKADLYPRTAGLARTALEGTLRRAVYVHAGSSVRFPAVATATGSSLSVGLAAAPGSSSGRWKVLVRTGSDTSSLADQEVHQGGWVDLDVDLPTGMVEVELSFHGKEGTVGLASEPMVLGRIEDAPLVVLYLIDTTAARHMGLYGLDKDNTPTLSALASDGVVFDWAYSQATHTALATASLMTFLDVAGHGVRSMWHKIPDELPTLAGRLADLGFLTASFITNVSAGERTGLDRGFDDLFDHSAVADERGQLRTLDKALLESWLARHADQPRFLYIHTAEPHDPYEPPEEYRNRIAPDVTDAHADRFSMDGLRENATSEQLDSFRALYQAEIAFADAQLGSFIALLRDQGLWDRTLLVVTSDHGEAFMEHGTMLHSRPPHEEQIHIPLLFTGPALGMTASRIVDPVRLIDVGPTILALLGHPLPGEAGKASLVGLMNGHKEPPRPVFADHVDFASTSLRMGPWKVMRTRQGASKERTSDWRLYNLETDPGETTDLSRTERRILRRLVERLNARTIPAADGQRRAITQEHLETLRALGYVK